MSVYFIANIRIHDPGCYQKYLDRAGEIFKKYRGTYLAVENNAKVLEGKWNYSRAVLISFPGKEEFDAWYNSPEYQEILSHRLSAADCDSILIGKDDHEVS